MKKLHFLLGAAALTLTACSNDEVVDLAQTQGIGFSTFVDKSTRSTDLDLSGLETSGFAVWGVTWDQETASSDPLTTIFTKQEVTYNEATGWTYKPLRYWTAGNEYRFTALAPYSAVNNSSILTSIEQITTRPTSYDEVKGGLKISFSNKAAAADVDLCCAMAKVQNAAANQSMVELNFSHMLSRVKFTFKNGFPSEKTVIKISDVAIKDATSDGTIDTHAGETSWTGTSNTFEITFTPQKIAQTSVSDYMLPGGSYKDGETDKRYEQETDHHYLLPLNIAKEYTVKFTAEVYTYDNTVNPPKYNEIGKYPHEVKLPSTTFKANYSYNFIADLDASNVNPEQQMYPIEFTAKVSPWDDWTNKDIELPVNDTTVNPEP